LPHFNEIKQTVSFLKNSVLAIMKLVTCKSVLRPKSYVSLLFDAVISVVSFCFYPPGASHARVLAIVVCLSVCVWGGVYVCVCAFQSRAGILSKRLNVGSRKQRHVIAQGH